MENPNDQKVEIEESDISHEGLTEEQLADDSIDWKEKAQHYEGIAKRRATKLAKLKEKGNKPADPAPLDKKPNDSKPDEFELDHGKKAYLKAMAGIAGSDELELVKAEWKRSGEDLDALLENPYFTAKLQKLRDAKSNAEAMPGNNRRGGNQANNSEEFHYQKYMQTGKLPEDPAMREKVVNMRLKKETDGKMFTDTPVVG
jgi:hypothetical protein